MNKPLPSARFGFASIGIDASETLGAQGSRITAIGSAGKAVWLLVSGPTRPRWRGPHPRGFSAQPEPQDPYVKLRDYLSHHRHTRRRPRLWRDCWHRRNGSQGVLRRVFDSVPFLAV